MLQSVLIIHLEGNSRNNPTLVALTDHLQARGVEVVYVPEPIPNDRSGFRSSRWDIVRHKLHVLFFDLTTSLGLMSLWISLKCRELCKKARRSDLIIGVDRAGLLYAAAVAKKTRKPYGLMSFEITFADEIGGFFKRPERLASRLLSFWTVQDPVRAGLLARENSIPMQPVLLPVASAGSPPVPPGRIRDRLGVPRDRKVAVLLGNISAYNMPREILSTVRNWPEDWVLIINDRYKLDLSGFLHEHQDLLNNRLFVNKTPHDTFDDVAELLAGVDAGLVFYQATHENRIVGKNMQHIGMSSGKLSTLLRNGIPVITSLPDQGGRQLLEYQAGVVVNSPADLPETLRAFPQKGMHENARKLFLEKYDYNLHAAQVWDTLAKAAGS